ncbi:hypothetical protein I7I51_02165 [Histoplasma capsulatum]|uniref:Uncharacterized protein n=1 Tax=Ajellomyces capsulatus TaxID=5037 RepID=A0A8A1M7E4_AJECA|nr:hypothetical protein I7I51_02165 [Histoplasma capsulatum]
MRRRDDVDDDDDEKETSRSEENGLSGQRRRAETSDYKRRGQRENYGERAKKNKIQIQIQFRYPTAADPVCMRNFPGGSSQYRDSTSSPVPVPRAIPVPVPALAQ